MHSYSVNPFNGSFCGPSSVLWGKDGISISDCQQNVFYSIFSQIQTVFEPVQGRARWMCGMTLFMAEPSRTHSYVTNSSQPVYGMACVVQCEPPPRMEVEVETLWVSTSTHCFYKYIYMCYPLHTITSISNTDLFFWRWKLCEFQHRKKDQYRK